MHTPFERFGEAVRQRRKMLGLTQAGLAQHLAMSRQNLFEIESGRRLPQLSTARQLAQVLGWSLDEMARHLPAEFDGGVRWVLDPPPLSRAPVVRTLLANRLVVAPAGRVTPDFSLDGYWDPATGQIEEVVGAYDPAATLFVAGCDPLLPWLWQRTPHPDLMLYLFPMGSQGALRALSDAAVHIAGTHLFDDQSRQYNRVVDALPFPALRWQYLQWDAGIMGSVSTPDGWVLRERGSEARALFERYRDSEYQPGGLVELDSHWAIARYVRDHPRLAGVGIRVVADAMNLPFTQWAREPYEWVTRAEWAGDWRIRLFENWLKSPAVAAALERMPGVEPWEPGRIK